MLSNTTKSFLAFSLMAVLCSNSFAFAQTATSLPDAGWLPDNGLYGLKIAIEDLQTALTFNDTAKAQLEIQHAQIRLAEIQAELQKGNTVAAQKAQVRHDKEIEDAETVADKQGNDNHGQQVKTYVHELIADHDQKIGQLVSAFAQSNQTSLDNNTGWFSQIKRNTDNVRTNHGDNEQANPNVHVPDKEDR